MNVLRGFRALSRGQLAFVICAFIVLGLGAGALRYLMGPPPMDFAARRAAGSLYPDADPNGVPMSLVHASALERGKYLTRAADCAACHTARGGEGLSGGLAFVLPFGTLYSTNITPDKDTGIGNYTDGQFLAAVRRGVRKDGAPLYPAMPYSSYAYLSDGDALAIKAYLFSLAPIHAPPQGDTLKFPFNQRWAVRAWSLLFARDSRFRVDPEHSPDWNRGAYLAEALAHCGECHTPRNVAFALNNRRKFGGAMTAGWHAYNITNDRNSGVGAWREEDLLAYLAAGHAMGHGSAAGPMGEAVDESFSFLTPGDLKALVNYVRSVPAIAEEGYRSPVSQPAPISHQAGFNADRRGEKIYEGACVSCHGWSGESPLSAFATLTGARAINDVRGTNAAQIVIDGMTRTSPQGVMPMPAFGAAYSDIEIAAVVNFVTGRFGNAPSALSEADVTQLRRLTSR